MRGITAMTRRGFIATACAAGSQTADPIIDIHQHTNYHGRTNENLIAHQRSMGVQQTILLPAGSKFGLAAGAGGNQTVLALATAYPGQFKFFANELPDIPEAKAVIEKYLKAGAIGIGEQKFPVECDAPCMQRVAEIARHYRVPVLMHFQHATYNLGFERFYRMLEKYHTVNFIGHAQTWWGNIDKNHQQAVLYPKGPVTPGGITDRLLSDYPNIYGDLSAGSGLNALLRDEDHARDFLERHQNRLVYGSDCEDTDGTGTKCSGSQQLAAVRRLTANAAVLRKILHDNAVCLLSGGRGSKITPQQCQALGKSG
jgi:predicted TIM-barrel fold metal-dependent hydrolase